MNLENDIETVLVSEEQIRAICKRLGEEITRDYAGKKLLLVSVLRGAVVFMADLMREIRCDCQIDFIAVSSYNGTKSTGVVTFKKDLEYDIKDMDVLIVEDILDSGLSLSYIMKILKLRQPASIRICAFLDKPSNRKVDLKADYVGTEVPNEFVVGYGMDYKELYRNLPYVGVLKPGVYEE